MNYRRAEALVTGLSIGLNYGSLVVPEFWLYRTLAFAALATQLGFVLGGAWEFRKGVTADRRSSRKLFLAHMAAEAEHVRKVVGRNYMLGGKTQGVTDEILCLFCGMASSNPNDIAMRYCGNCHKYLDDRKLS